MIRPGSKKGEVKKKKKKCRSRAVGNPGMQESLRSFQCGVTKAGCCSVFV